MYEGLFFIEDFSSESDEQMENDNVHKSDVDSETNK